MNQRQKNILNLSPFEGMYDLKWVLIISIFFLLGIALGYPVIFTVLLVILLLFVCIRLVYRLGSPWRRIHYSLIHRYVYAEGFYVGVKIREEDKEKLSKEDFEIIFKEVVGSIYQSWNKEDITNFVNEACDKFRNFSDKNNLERWLEKNLQNKEKKNIKDAVLEAKKLFQKNEGFVIQAIIANVIEKRYGIKEREKYIQAILRGSAS